MALVNAPAVAAALKRVLHCKGVAAAAFFAWLRILCLLLLSCWASLRVDLLDSIPTCCTPLLAGFNLLVKPVPAGSSCGACGRTSHYLLPALFHVWRGATCAAFHAAPVLYCTLHRVRRGRESTRLYSVAYGAPAFSAYLRTAGRRTLHTRARRDTLPRARTHATAQHALPLRALRFFKTRRALAGGAGNGGAPRCSVIAMPRYLPSANVALCASAYLYYPFTLHAGLSPAWYLQKRLLCGPVFHATACLLFLVSLLSPLASCDRFVPAF